MIIFITSSPCLEGEAEITGMNGFLDDLRAAVPEGAKGLFVTAAPDDEGYSDWCAYSMKNSLEISGISFNSYDLLDRRTASEAAALVSRSNFIILGGGHTPTQNAFFQEIELKKLLKGFKGVIMGISAGSMNLAKTVYSHPEEPGEAVSPEYQRFLPGLSLTTYQICPHLQKVRYNILDGLRLFEDVIFKDSFGNTFYALPDGSYIRQEKGHAVLRGEAYLIKDGEMREICREGGEIKLK
jgi:dipeptidase E